MEYMGFDWVWEVVVYNFIVLFCGCYGRIEWSVD